jgi:general stress protein YciG
VKKIDPMLSKYLSKIGRKGGTVSSKRKAQAARENGKRGGRPKKALKPASNVA